MANDESGSKSPYLIKLILLGVAVVIAAVLLWQMAGDDVPEEAPPTVTREDTIPEPRVEPEPEPAPAPEPEPAEEEEAPEREPEPEPLPDLADSDAVAMAAAEDVSGEELRDLLTSDSIIMKSVRAVIGLSDGNVVHEYRPVASPTTPFVVEKLDEPPNEEVGQRYRLSADNYERYDKYVDVVAGLDPRTVAEVYQRFYPLLEEAYTQHGDENGSFKEVTLEAIDSLLAAPVLEEEPILIQPKVHYQFENEELESLPGPQKLLIRMGPENTREVQAKLREIREQIAARAMP